MRNIKKRNAGATMGSILRYSENDRARSRLRGSSELHLGACSRRRADHGQPGSDRDL